MLDEILEYLEKSIGNLAKESFENIEIEGGLEGMKNKVIQKKQVIISKIINHKN
jgi:hypothetical protein